jgi:hypothetical protein
MLLRAYNAQLCGEAIPYELLVERGGYAAKHSHLSDVNYLDRSQKRINDLGFRYCAIA